MKKRWNRIKKINKFKLFCLIMSIILLFLATYRAITTSITYDEAYTYLNYLNTDNYSFKDWIFSFKYMLFPTKYNVLLNNHVLNTFFIGFFVMLFHSSYNEFLIRLPNLIFYVLYLIYSYKFTKDYKGKYAFFGLLALNYGLNDFFSLGRGYGICTALVLMGIFYFREYLNKPSKSFNLILTYIFLILSSYANSVSLIIVASFMIITFYYLLKEKELIPFIKKYWYWIIIFAFVLLLIIRYHFLVSTDDLPVYGGNNGFFKDVIVSMFVSFGFTKYYGKIALGVLCLVFIGLVVYRKNIFKDKLFLTIPIYYILMILMIKISGKLWITGRCLLPTYPLVCIGVFKILELIKNKKIFYSFNLLILIVSVVVFSSNINLNESTTWGTDRYIKPAVYKAYDENNINYINDLIDPNNPAVDFYIMKFGKERGYFLDKDGDIK